MISDIGIPILSQSRWQAVSAVSPCMAEVPARSFPHYRGTLVVRLQHPPLRTCSLPPSIEQSAVWEIANLWSPSPMLHLRSCWKQNGLKITSYQGGFSGWYKAWCWWAKLLSPSSEDDCGPFETIPAGLYRKQIEFSRHKYTLLLSSVAVHHMPALVKISENRHLDN